MLFYKDARGSISIFLILVMLTVFVFGGLTVDGARIGVAKNSVSMAGELAMTAALSEYNDVLKDMYGLFALSEDTDKLQKNVSAYFNKTINSSGVLSGGDSYTRSFLNSIFSYFSSDDMSFDNIVDMGAESFKLQKLSDSVLANPAVLERQIIDYMKFRAPVSIGAGMLTKIGCIGEISKQTKALEAKVDYEKKLGYVQDACEKAYESIIYLNEVVSEYSFNGDDAYRIFADDINIVYEYCLKMTEYIIACRSENLQIINRKELDALKSEREKELLPLYDENGTVAVLKYLSDTILSYMDAQSLEEGEYILKYSQFNDMMAYLSTYDEDLGRQITFMQLLSTVPLHELYVLLALYEDFYNMADEALRQQLLNEYNSYMTLWRDVVSVLEKAWSIAGLWYENANYYGRSAAALLYDNWYSGTEDICHCIDACINSLENVLVKVEKIEDKRDVWAERISDLSEGDIKASMEGDFAGSAMDINTGSVNSLIEVLKRDKEFVVKLKQIIDEMQYFDEKVCLHNSEEIDYHALLQKIEGRNIKDENDLMAAAKVYMDEEYTAVSPASLETYNFIRIDDKQTFYAFLCRICSAAVDTSEDKNEAKAKRKELLKQGSDISGQTAAIEDINTGSVIGEGGISAELSTAIDLFAENIEAFNHTYTPSAMSTSAGNDKLADTGMKNLSGIASLLSGFKDIAETLRDSIYLEEYFTEMFSCYTSGLAQEQSKIKVYDTDNFDKCRFYRSEAEYILWGNENIEANLNNTKALIFGIRFALNSVYAFTSSDTRMPALSLATAIAGWTGFGVPLVQTIILLAWAMAESIIDVNNLCEGKAVCIYKSDSTWVLGINGAVNYVKEAALNKTEDIFDKLEAVSEESIDKANDYVCDYINTTTSEIAEGIKSSIITGLESLVLQITGADFKKIDKEFIRGKIDGFIDSLESDNDNTEVSSAAKKAVAAQMRSLKLSKFGGRTIRDYITDTLSEIVADAKDDFTSTIYEKISAMINDIADSINSRIIESVNKHSDEFKEKAADILEDGRGRVKERLADVIDKYTKGISDGKVEGNMSVASGFNLTYKEYLKIFMLLNLKYNKSSMLANCAKLIQINVSAKDKSFDITEAATMIEAKADIWVKTTFFFIPKSRTATKDFDYYDFDIKRSGINRQSIEYAGLLGY